MIKVRGNRIHFTPDADAEMPEAERRVFSFCNPSVSHFERLGETHVVSREGRSATVSISGILLDLLRGWRNIRTDDPVVAEKYGVKDTMTGDGVVVPFPPSRKEIEFYDVLPQDECKELIDTVWTKLNPTPSGNSESPSGSQSATSAPDAGQSNAAPIGPGEPTT